MVPSSTSLLINWRHKAKLEIAYSQVYILIRIPKNGKPIHSGREGGEWAWICVAAHLFYSCLESHHITHIHSGDLVVSLRSHNIVMLVTLLLIFICPVHWIILSFLPIIESCIGVSVSKSPCEIFSESLLQVNTNPHGSVYIIKF